MSLHYFNLKLQGYLTIKYTHFFIKIQFSLINHKEDQLKINIEVKDLILLIFIKI